MWALVLADMFKQSFTTKLVIEEYPWISNVFNNGQFWMLTELSLDGRLSVVNVGVCGSDTESMFVYRKSMTEALERPAR